MANAEGQIQKNKRVSEVAFGGGVGRGWARQRQRDQAGLGVGVTIGTDMGRGAS